jgi:Asp-tRNA(Asn)/Glu-tRNA(Gln) amidotransferase A subunit family amidase
MQNLWQCSAVELRAAIRDGKATVAEVAEAHLARIAAREPTLHAWVTHDPEAARAQAAGLAKAAADLPLLGLPIGIKDIIETADLPTTYGSPIYRSHRPATDAVIVARLREAGALIMGKTVTTEFAHMHAGPTVNPHNAAHTPGGSSSGSAAGVAEGMIPLALATQTGGSTIRPAAYCGIVGFKPTFGLLPMAGIKPLAPSLDTLGLYGRSVADVALLFGALSGRDVSAPEAGLTRALRIGLHPGPYASRASADARAALDAACAALRAAGVVVDPINLPEALFARIGEANTTIMAYEAARSLALEFENDRPLLSANIVKLIGIGQSIAEADYRSALAAGADGRQALAEGMRGFDSLITFSAPGAAPIWAEGTGDSTFNRIWTTIGAPCITLPVSRVASTNLPLGVQLVDCVDGDSHLLQVAAGVAPLLPEFKRW